MIEIIYGWFASWNIFTIGFFVAGAVVDLSIMLIVNLIRSKVYK